MVAASGDKRKIVNIRYSCYVCGESYKNASYAITHVLTKHGHRLPSRKPGISRPFSGKYKYENDIYNEWEEQHHGCPSCWFHSDDYEEFQAHVEAEHCEKQEDMMVIEKSDEKKSVRFEDEADVQSNGDSDRKGPDFNKAADIVQQIVDLGNLLKSLLKI